MVSASLGGPPLTGEKVSEIWQLPLGLIVDGHWLVEKSPVTPMLLMVRVSVPMLVNVRMLGGLVVPTACEPRSRLVWSSATMGATPTPASEITFGLPAAFSVTVRLPVRGPMAAGVKPTWTRQLEAGRIVVQLSAATEKSPVATALRIVTG